MKSKYFYLMLAFLICFAPCITIASMGQRTITTTSCSADIKLSIVPFESAMSYAVEETLPSGLYPYSINENGQWDSQSNIIEWGTFRDSKARSLAYRLTGVNGSYTVDGILSIDGISQSIENQDNITIDCSLKQVASPVFSPATGSVPITVSISCETEGATIYYTTDASLPDITSLKYENPINITSRSTIRAIAIKQGLTDSQIGFAQYFPAYITAGEISRSITHNQTCSPLITLTVIPGETIQSHAIMEQLAPGFIPININENGFWDLKSHTIQWGTFRDNIERTLTYEISGMNGTIQFNGMASFDGSAQDTSGDLSATIDCSLKIVEKPVFTPSTGDVPINVSISCPTPDAQIYYTIDGSQPYSGSLVYENDITLSTRTLLRAIATKSNMNDSEITTSLFTEPEPVYSEKQVSIINNQSCTPGIIISITPNETVRSYAVKEILPSGVTPKNINENGVWKASDHSIYWGTFRDHTPRHFIFQLTGNNGEMSLSGIASFDGFDQSLPETQVDIFCESLPVLSVDQTSYTVSATSGMFSISVYNSELGTLNWFVETTDNWFTIESASGVNAGAFTVIYNTNLAETRTGSISITSNALNSPQLIHIIQKHDQLPVISHIGTQTTNEDKPVNVNVYIHDEETDARDLTMEVYSSASDLVSDNNIEISGNHSNRIITLTPKANASGFESITITVSDGLHLSHKTFLLAVNPVNDPPQFTSGSVPLLYEDDGEKRIDWANNIITGPEDESDQECEFIIHPQSHALFETSPRLTSDGILSFRTAPNAYGSAVFDVKLKDNGGTDNGGIDTSDVQRFTVVITPVNDCPDFETQSDVLIHNWDGQRLFPNWISNINTGPNESGQDIEFHVTTNHDDLFLSPPELSQAGDLTIIPNPDKTGIAIVSVHMQDDGGTSFGGCNTSNTHQFTVTVHPTFYQLTVLQEGFGRIQLDDTTILPKYVKQYQAGTIIHITATPDMDWQFSGWHGDITSPSNALQLTMDEDMTLTAIFYEPPVTLSINGKQQIKINNEIVDLPWSESINRHSFVQLSPVSTSDFIKWSGDLNTNDHQVTIQLEQDTSIAALFKDPFEWSAVMHAESEDFGWKYQDDIRFGISLLEITQPAEITNYYSCSMFLYSNDWEMLSTDIRKEGSDYQWILGINPHGNIGSPSDRTSIISWDPVQLSEKGYYRLVKGYDETQEVVVSDMRTTTEIEVTGGNSEQFFKIIWTPFQDQFEFTLNTGWNLISIPLFPDSTTVTDLFPNAEISYKFQSGAYHPVTTLQPGIGYWLKIPQESTYQIYGQAFQSNTVTLSKGWHLFGAIDISSMPETIPLTSITAIYEYTGGSYRISDELKPGRGHWIKINQECEFTIESDRPKKQRRNK